MAPRREDWHLWWKHNGARELNDLLLIWWDPIGVYGVPEARDEYRSYVGSIGTLLGAGSGTDSIASALRTAESRIGLPSREGPERTAERIAAWYAQVEPNIPRGRDD